jgi:histidyl-tRNA synthetase
MDKLSFKKIRGTEDILPEKVGVWRRMENTAREVFDLYCYKELRTPILEETGLFISGVGETSDIVTKQMFSFVDGKGRSLTMRPEGTAPIIRAYLEHGIHKSPIAKIFYMGPFFRSERPQAGRERQFHQIGAEAIGCDNPSIDAEIISLLVHLLNKFGITGGQLELNSVGCSICQGPYKEKLKEYFAGEETSLCSDCHRRLNENPLRVLDCKRPECQSLVVDAPTFPDYLCNSCSEHFQKVQTALKSLDISYHLHPYLVRGLDYYTRTAFEITHPALGSQNAVAAGGRFDNLVEKMGGEPTPAVGFALGMERVILIQEKEKVAAPGESRLCVYLAPQGEEAFQKMVKLLKELRRSGIKSELDYEGKRLKNQLRLANKLGCQYVAILGEDELKRKIVTLKNMDTGEQEELPIDLSDCVNFIKKRATSHH